MKEFFTTYAGEFITAIIAGFGGWFFQRKKQDAEVQSSEIENAEKVLKYYREMLEDLGGRLKEAITELQSAKTMIRDQEATIESLSGRLKEAITELQEAKTMIRDLETTIEGLTDELKKYKQLNGKKETRKEEPDAISN